MLTVTKIKLMQPVMKVIAIAILFFAPIQSYSQAETKAAVKKTVAANAKVMPLLGSDWCTVTIESVKCISASTGQDEYTSFLFTGIETALSVAAGFATGGGSLGPTTALQFAKEIAKEAASIAVEELVVYGAQKLYSANEEQILGLANNVGVNVNEINKIAQVANQVMELTSLEGMFNKVYGVSPDALYIKVNGTKVWPSGQSVSIKSQDLLTVGHSFDIQKNKPFTIQLMEYDYGSNDDDLGSQTFNIPENFIGTGWIRNQVFYHKEEGSVYKITLRFETKLKHHFINKLAYSGWDFKVGDRPMGVFVFEPTKLDFQDPINQAWNGFYWGIHFVDRIKFFNPTTNSQYYVTFDSENSFTGYSMIDKRITISGKRRASMHRYINDLVGSSWKQTNDGGETYFTYGASGILEQGLPGASDPYKHQRKALTWQIAGGDKIKHCDKDNCFLLLKFTSKNDAVGEYSNMRKEFNAKWKVKTPIYTAVRVNSSTQNQQVQTQAIQHRFINNIVGSAWNYTEAGGGTFTFNIGQNTIDNFSYPGAGWEGVTWKVIGNDKIQLKGITGVLMDLTFSSPNSFSGYSWNNNTLIVTGTSRQAQQQNFQHRFINNIVGSSWNYFVPGNPALSFSFGNSTITNFLIPGTFWDAVTWKVIGNDKIQLMASNGVTMDLTFYDTNNFNGYSWNDNINIVNGTIRQAEQHHFINNIIGTSWMYTEPGNPSYSFSFGNGTITNFSNPGTYWDAVTWKIIGNDKIQLTTPQGNAMDLTFSDQNNFSGSFWNNGTSIVTGSKFQAQNQQQQVFQHRYINNIIGSSWNYTEPDGNQAKTFNFGNGTINNFSIPGTYWDAVTWKVIGNDKIQLMAANGATMDLTFSDKNNFSGYYWNDWINIVNGTNRQPQY